jgi:ferredoxin
VLSYAQEVGMVEKSWSTDIDRILKDYSGIRLEPPYANPIVKLIQRSDIQRLIDVLRGSKLFKYLMSTKPMSWALYTAGIRQDAFSSDNLEWGSLDVRDTSRCGGCTKCTQYCPVDLDLPANLNSENCIECLYCFMVCPENIIEFNGQLGFMEEHLKKYGWLIRKITV